MTWYTRDIRIHEFTEREKRQDHRLSMGSANKVQLSALVHESFAAVEVTIEIHHCAVPLISRINEKKAILLVNSCNEWHCRSLGGVQVSSPAAPGTIGIAVVVAALFSVLGPRCSSPYSRAIVSDSMTATRETSSR
jgi:hypothetical protein